MKTHRRKIRQAALVAALVLWLGWAAGCATTGIENPPPAVRMVGDNTTVRHAQPPEAQG